MNQKELLEMYNKGEISFDVYVEALRNLHREKSKSAELNVKLNEKLDKEYEDFCKEIMTKDKKEIFDRAYEITVKEEIKETLKDLDMFNEEKEIIISQDDILTEFYHDWLDSDVPLGDVLRYGLEESIAVLTRYKKKENKEDER